MDGQNISDANLTTTRLCFDELRAVIRTERAMVALMRATAAGNAPIAGVLPMLSEVFGARFLEDSSAALNAGMVVAELMRECGFVEDRRIGPPGHADGGLRWRLPSARR